jgi:hypothetical protein
LLSAVCRWFADQGISIEAADIATDDGTANDVFLIEGECDTVALARHLSGPTSRAVPTPASVLRALVRCPTNSANAQ